MAPLGHGGMYLATTIQTRADKLGQRAISAGEARRMREMNEELLARVHVAETQLADFIRRQREIDSLFGREPYAQWRRIPARAASDT